MRMEGSILESIHQHEDTIAAVASPPGRGGVAVIRVSGPRALAMLRRIFRSPAIPGGEVPARRVLLGRVVEPETDRPVDEVLCFYMPAPRSYTGEDVVEFHCHGGPVPVEGVLGALIAAGARPAEPGEFTRRAFINGRMDLSQAEAVADLIAARSRVAAEFALDQLGGRLGRAVRSMRGRIIELMASIEVVLDYPELDIDDRDLREIADEGRSLSGELRRLLESAAAGRPVREGVRTAILGRPNVGKSSLLNALLGRDRAIVTAIPGTTRDTVEEELVVQGIPLVLIDTAGIRQSDDDVERIGVERARAAGERAELVLLVLDDSQGITPEDRDLLRGIRGFSSPVVVINKTDVGADRLPDRMVGEFLPGVPVVRISALTGAGIPELEAAIAERITGGHTPDAGEEGLILTNARHEEAVRAALHSLGAFRDALEAGLPVDVASIDLRETAEHLGRITGETVTEDLLDSIFANYCIGK